MRPRQNKWYRYAHQGLFNHSNEAKHVNFFKKILVWVDILPYALFLAHPKCFSLFLNAVSITSKLKCNREKH